MFARKLLFGLFLISTALFQVSCAPGSGGFVNGIRLDRPTYDGLEYVALKATMKTGGLRLVSATFPIYHPRRPTEVIGEASIAGSLDGQTAEATALIRYDVFPQLPRRGQNTLPNGAIIPIAGVEKEDWLTLAVSSKSKFYLNINEDRTNFVLGMTFGIDALSTGVTGTVLPAFQLNRISGIAGIYSGPRAGQSGLALFVEVSRKPSTDTFRILTASTPATLETSSLRFESKGSANDYIRLQKRILRLQEQNALLTIE